MLKNTLFYLQLFAEDAPDVPTEANQQEADADPAPREQETRDVQDEPTPSTSEENAAEQSVSVPEETGEDREQSEEQSLEALTEELRQKLLAAKTRKVIQTWERDAQQMKTLYPGFSLPEEMAGNQRFAALVRAGVDVQSAYEVANLKKILSCAMRYASLTAGKKTALAISQQGMRPRENSVLDRASSIRHTDVDSLTEKDIRKILDQVSHGAKISF